MAHYARVNSENIVTYVTPVDNDLIIDENGLENDDLALNHLYSTIPDSINDRWIKTSYNNNIRYHYAGIGYSYNEQLDAFVRPKPFDSWLFNEEICDWEAPIPKPEINPENPEYIWDEELLNWIPVY